MSSQSICTTVNKKIKKTYFPTRSMGAGVITYTEEYTSPIPLARAYQAVVLDADKLIPKLMPQAFQSIEIIQGDGGVGSIKQINFAPGTPFTSVKHRIDEIDEKAYKYSYTMIEGDALTGKLEKIHYETQLAASRDGGTTITTTTSFFPLPGVVLNEEELKAGMGKAGEMFKVVEDYLIQNP